MLREEATLNESLTKIEDENNYLDGHITELNNVQAMAAGEVAQAEKDLQEQKFTIASKEL